MSALTPSLRGRILRAFALIVVLAAALGVGVAYYATQGQVDGFVAQLVAVEADNVARSLSRAYRAYGGWAAVERVIEDAGYRYEQEEPGHEDGGERDRELSWFRNCYFKLVVNYTTKGFID